MPSPRLWWPNRLGDQPLYTLRAEALCGDAAADCQTLRLGLRTLTVSREKDAWGEEFAFCCNGVKFFAMGADYIPEDNLLARCTRARTEELRALTDEILAEGRCLTVGDLAVGGGDLLALGMAPGPGVGRVLRTLLEEVWDEKLPNGREALLRRAEELKEETP